MTDVYVLEALQEDETPNFKDVFASLEAAEAEARRLVEQECGCWRPRPTVEIVHTPAEDEWREEWTVAVRSHLPSSQADPNSRPIEYYSITRCPVREI